MPSTSSSAGSDAAAGARSDTRVRRSRRILLLVVAGAVVLVVAAVTALVVVGSENPAPRTIRNPSRVTATVAPGEVVVGQPVPDFTLPGLSGGAVRLSDLRGRPVVLDVWASWCNPCRKEFPLLRAAEREYRRRHLAIVGVSFRDIAADARAFAASRHADWPLARDPGGIFAGAYAVNRVPQTFFIDADGVLVSRVFGITSAADLDAEIARILG